MNIFVLDKDPVVAAQMQCDKHVVKMILESAQMLSTAHRLLDGEDVDERLYKVAHPKHPCTLWTMESTENYRWLYRHFVALAVEYKMRYNKTHKSYEKLSEVLSQCPKNIPKGRGLTEFRLAMGSNPECKFEGNPVKSYRAFYKTKEKRFEMKWTKRKKPNWFLTDDSNCVSIQQTI
jgi:hypothetical protein